MTYLGKAKIAIHDVKTLKLFTVTKLKLRHFSQFYIKCSANSGGRGTFWTKRRPKGEQILHNLAKKVS